MNQILVSVGMRHVSAMSQPFPLQSYPPLPAMRRCRRCKMHDRDVAVHLCDRPASRYQKAARRRLRTTFPRAASRRASAWTRTLSVSLLPYFAAKLGRADLLARVASPRGGDVRVCVRGDREQSCAAWRARSRHDDGAAVAWAAEGRLSLTLSEPDKAPPPPPRSAGEPGWARMVIWADAACRIVVPCTLMGRATGPSRERLYPDFEVRARILSIFYNLFKGCTKPLK